MAEENLERQDPAVWAKFPWQMAVIVLLSAVSILSGWFFKKSYDDNEREKLRTENWKVAYNAKTAEVQRLQDKLNNCQEGKSEFILSLFNNELALKLSKDTSSTSKLIIQSLIKANEQRLKQDQK